MAELCIQFLGDEQAGVDAARALCNEVEEAPGVHSAALGRGQQIDTGAKAGEAITLAAVVLQLLPVGAQGTLDFLKAYFGRPGSLPTRMTVQLASGAKIEAEFDPQHTSPEELEQLARAFKAVLEG